MTAVKLYLRPTWRCPLCQARQIEEPIIAELNQEEISEIKELDIDVPAITGHWASLPETVRCKLCDIEFLVEDED